MLADDQKQVVGSRRWLVEVRRQIDVTERAVGWQSAAVGKLPAEVRRSHEVAPGTRRITGRSREQSGEQRPRGAPRGGVSHLVDLDPNLVSRSFITE